MTGPVVPARQILNTDVLVQISGPWLGESAFTMLRSMEGKVIPCNADVTDILSAWRRLRLARCKPDNYEARTLVLFFAVFAVVPFREDPDSPTRQSRFWRGFLVGLRRNLGALLRGMPGVALVGRLVGGLDMVLFLVCK
jgi:hypothetical protein